MRREYYERNWQVPPSYWGVVSVARRLLSAVTWFGIAAVVAGVSVWWQLEKESVLAAALLALLLVLPGLIVLHFVFVVRSMMTSVTSVRFAGLARRVVTLRMIGWTLFVRPWYWLALGVSCLASAALIPVAIIVVLV